MNAYLSIIIVAYKSYDEIGPCLGSIPRDLGGRPVEVILVDNYPTDGIEGLLADRYPRVHYVNPKENLGFGRGNNLGFARASGEYILFLNPDTVITKEALVHCLERMKNDSRIGLISPKLVQADGTFDQACRRSIPSLWDGFCRASGLAGIFPGTALFNGYNLGHLPIDGTYGVGAINGAFMLAPRRLIEEVAPDDKIFDEAFFMYGDDLDLCIRVSRAGWKIVYDGSVSIIHLKGTSVAKDYELMSKAIFDANRDVYLKHFNPRNSRLTRWKYRAAFAVWKWIALIRAKLRGHRQVRPI